VERIPGNLPVSWANCANLVQIVKGAGVELLTAAQMRAIERAAIDSGEVTGLDLMERAGRGVVEAILEWRPELATAPHRAVVLCGPGNNGGDGFVVARLLHQRGWEVEVFLYGDEAKLPPDAAENCRRWRAMGEVRETDCGAVHACRANIYVDALFGTGLSRPLPGEALDALSVLDERRALDGAGIVAVDVPSWLCADSGRVLGGPAILGHDLTVTFHRPKVGHSLEPGAHLSGRLALVDIGLSDASSHRERVERVDRGGSWLPIAAKHSSLHKFAHGHALVLSGGPGKGGAARLAARGALRIGAGLVTVGCPPAALIENAARLDAIMLRPVAGAEGLAEVLADDRINALCLGPGLGLERARQLVPVALGAKRATVLDADALTVFAEDPSALFALLHPRCVLTPHMGEFGRLFPDLKAKLDAPATRGPAYSKVDAAREAAARAGCVVLLKGPDTVIADPEGRCAINSAHYERSAPWLATAGSGDVLAGFIAGLLARGFPPMQAAETAAWLHVECALAFGPGLIAEDIPEQLPAVFRALGL
jgi:ADP-dependent NAD(P)H-hydrate dehydratase / NAD(P)H-hydrate epimerase